jgi:cysteine desulfurase/selenocysteine lyase
MLGPPGIGILYARRALLESMDPFLGGGDMIREVHLREAKWNDVPWKFEAGTPNIAGTIGLGAAIDYLTKLGMRNIRDHERDLTKYALEEMYAIDFLKVYGPKDSEKRVGVISFNVDGVHPHDVATILDEEGISIRSGQHCAQPLLERLGVPATCRASFYIYNTKEEIDLLIEALKKVRKIFGY